MNAQLPIPYAQRSGWAVVLGMWLGVGALGVGNVVAAQGISRDEALAAAFPSAQIRQEQVFLTAAQQMDARKRGGVEVPSALIARYIATRDGRVVGHAYVDTHTVRTKKESLLISLDENGTLKRVDVTAFLEPVEYRPSDAWLAQYRNRQLGGDLAINRAIRPIAGASLTARAANTAVRRVLAIDQVLREQGGSR